MIGIFPNHAAGGDRTVKLKRNIELRHVDNHLHAELFSSNLFCISPHREVELSAGYGGHAGRGAADGDSLDIFER